MSERMSAAASPGDDGSARYPLPRAGVPGTGKRRYAVAAIIRIRAERLPAVSVVVVLALGRIQACRWRAIIAPARVPAALRRMSLSAASLPGTIICSSSMTVAASSPKIPANTADRPFHAMAIPSGTKRQKLRIASPTFRRPMANPENGEGGAVPVGSRVTTRIAARMATMAAPFRRLVERGAIFSGGPARYFAGARTDSF